MPKKAHFAEVIESSLQLWTAQSWQWNHVADFASLVVAEEKERIVFGLIFHIETGSWHNDRTPFPYQKTEDELLKEQPQIFELLRTTFKCLTLGYAPNGASIAYHYAPQPPKIHGFVRPATAPEITAFFSNDRSLPIIFAAQHLFNLEELLIGLIQFRIKNGLFEPSHCAEFMHTFSLLTGNDYRRLKVFTHRLQPLLAAIITC